ncbi:MAG: hypothetical protein BAJALOKI2v1_660022 [Promethearchaeota archaeon]|nr:MAG: hypothetical protein BAJALOKI2v1_660022 [Candidatus Lokiarchaeota archaeon]
MVYFEISNLGINCGHDKSECPSYPIACNKCIKDKLKQLGLEIHSNTKISEIDSEEKRLQMHREIIWQVFLNLLNIKHIVIMAKSSGLSIIDYPLSGSGIDVSLLTGFIQANITFSESGEELKEETSIVDDQKFYEFDYKKFNILLKEGKYIRVCLILDNNASESLKSLVNDFLRQYEIRYQDKLIRLEKTGATTFEDTIDYIIEHFNIKLVFPMTLSHTIAPHITESIQENYIQTAVFNFAKELLISKPFFFINNLLNKVKEIVDIQSDAILYEIYKLIQMDVFIPTSLEKAESHFRTFRESRAKKLASNKVLSSLIDNDNGLDVLKEKAKNMDEQEAEKMMKSFIRKGENAEDASLYQAAIEEYEKAFYLATGFNFEPYIGKISYLIVELQQKINKMEIEYAQNAAENAEKQNDYINSIRYYQQAINLLEKDLHLNGNESKIKKLKKKISKLQKKKL